VAYRPQSSPWSRLLHRILSLENRYARSCVVQKRVLCAGTEVVLGDDCFALQVLQALVGTVLSFFYRRCCSRRLSASMFADARL
jgi:hypothetical protein